MKTAKPSPLRALPQLQHDNRTMMPVKSSLQATASHWHPTQPSGDFSSSFTKPLTNDFNGDYEMSRNINDGAVRYVNVRVAVPVDTPPEHIAGYVQSSLQIQHKRHENYAIETESEYSWEVETALYQNKNHNQSINIINSKEFHPTGSPYAFVPINPNNNRDSIQPRTATMDQKPYRTSMSPFSPITQRSQCSFGNESPALSLMTLDTAELTESSISCVSTPSSSRICSPGTATAYLVSPPPLFKQQPQRPSSINNFNSKLSSINTRSNIPSIALDYSSRLKIPTKNANGRKSPAVVNNRKSNVALRPSNVTGEDDEVRKSRIKTEMCMHYLDGNPCPFGSSCTYAHGEEELQMTKLIDMHEAGLIDMDTFRIKPCWTWLATGSCPFGKRCNCIHDPRISSSQASWLPHTETQGNTIATDINVEALHQKRLNTIHYNNPFGIEKLAPVDICKSLKNDNLNQQWKTIYDLVTDGNNHTDSEGWSVDNKQQRRCGRNQVHPIIKLQIALKIMEESGSEWSYKYRPQHFVHGEFCMVLSKRAFRINSSDGHSKKKSTNQRNNIKSNTDMTVVEIPISSYNRNLSNHLIVREIAFGPDSDPTVRGVALWFQIDEKDVSECTPQQAKRFRWKKGIKSNKNENENSKHPQNYRNGAKISIFDSPCQIDSFPMVRPHDSDAYKLTTEILKHRLSVLRNERLSSMKERFECLKNLEAAKRKLEDRFRELQRSWLAWAWPTNVGRENVDRSTSVPAVDAYYKIKIQENDGKSKFESDEDEDEDLLRSCIIVDKSNAEHSSRFYLGMNVNRIWNSFVQTNFEDNESALTVQISPSIAALNMPRRLEIFERLANGCSINEDNCDLPHIKRVYCKSNSDASKKKRKKGTHATDLEQQMERCWEALLLEPTEETGMVVYENEGDINGCLKTEWDIVRDHFKNSRSNKVLKIIQQ